MSCKKPSFLKSLESYEQFDITLTAFTICIGYIVSVHTALIMQWTQLIGLARTSSARTSLPTRLRHRPTSLVTLWLMILKIWYQGFSLIREMRHWINLNTCVMRRYAVGPLSSLLFILVSSPILRLQRKYCATVGDASLFPISSQIFQMFKYM